MQDIREHIYVIPNWILERWIIVAYLIINWRMKDLAKRIQIKPDIEFFKVVSEHLTAYVKNDIMPPEDIAPAIMNLADDHMAGRKMNLRAGDYIAIQNHLRKGR